MISDERLHFDCAATIARLYPYLDRELAPDEAAAVAEHLVVCGDCTYLFHFEDRVLTLIGQRLGGHVAPAGLRRRLALLLGVERGAG